MTVVSIVKRELKAYFTSPIIYVVVSVFLIISGYFFYTNLVMCVLFAGSGVNLDLWEYTFNDISYVLLLLLPLISMRLFAEEKKLGTIELLATSPLRDTDILLGKYLAGLLVISLMLLLTALYPLLLAIIHFVPLSVVLTGYAGLFLLGACFLACGILLSSLTENQIVAAIATSGLLIFFWFIDRNEDIAGAFIGKLLQDLSLFRHFFNFARGVIDTRDIIFFISLAGGCLLLTLLSIQSRYWKGMFATIPNNRARRLVSSTIILIAALIPLNVLGNNNNVRFDVTHEKKFTLSQQTAEVLSTVRDAMHITVLGTKEQRRSVEDYLELMQASCPQVQYAFVDINKNPAKAAAFKDASDKAGFVEYRGRQEFFTSFSEADVLQAILFLARRHEKVACFITGQGERDPASIAQGGFSDVAAVLRAEQFTISQINIDGTREIPPDTLLLIAAGPQQDYSEAALNAMGKFFEQGGRVLLLLDPASLPNCTKFLARYNVELGTDIVVDRDSQLADMDELTPVIFINREHSIAQHLSAAVLFPHSRSVQVGPTPVAGLSWEILAQSGRGTWAERTIQSEYDKKADYHEGEDLRGPVQVGVIVKKVLDSKGTRKEGRMVIAGNARFAANEYLKVLGNKDFFLGITNWLAEETAVTNAQPVPQGYQRVPLVSLTDAESRLVFWSCVIIQPLIIFCVGTCVMLWRRYAC